MTKIKHASLFTGAAAGFDLAAQWMGWDNTFQVEIDEYCLYKLIKNFPDVPKYQDIRSFRGEQYRNTIDVLSGGFPCQPFSLSGKRTGREHDAYLWPEMLRVIREIQPVAIIGENVPGIIGMELDNVCSDLEGEGYKVQSFVIPACATGAWHQRDRVWIVCYSERFRQYRDYWRESEQEFTERRPDVSNPDRPWQPQSQRFDKKIRQRPEYCGQDVADSSSNRGGKSSQKHQAEQPDKDDETGGTSPYNDSKCSQKQCEPKSTKPQYDAPRCDSWWSTEPRVGRVANGIPDRVARLKALGNAVVPQVVYKVFQAIEHLIK